VSVATKMVAALIFFFERNIRVHIADILPAEDEDRRQQAES
jgi:hypothetical protein